MKEPPLRTSCGGGSFVLRNVREGQPSDPATTTSSDCGAERGGRGWQGLLSRLLFRGIAAKPRASLGIEGELITSNALLELFCQFKSPSMILLGGIKTPK